MKILILLSMVTANLISLNRLGSLLTKNHLGYTELKDSFDFQTDADYDKHSWDDFSYIEENHDKLIEGLTKLIKHY